MNIINDLLRLNDRQRLLVLCKVFLLYDSGLHAVRLTEKLIVLESRAVGSLKIGGQIDQLEPII